MPDELGEGLDPFVQLVEARQDVRSLLWAYVDAHAADDVDRVCDAAAGELLHDIEHDLAVSPRVHEDGSETDVLGQHAQPENMAVDAFELAHKRPHGQPPRRHGQPQQPLDGQAIARGVCVRADARSTTWTFLM